MKTRICTLFLLLLTMGAIAQEGVKIMDTGGTGGLAPDNNAILELNSTNRGLLLPRLILTSRDLPAPLLNHVPGMMAYNVSNHHGVDTGLYYNNGARWIKVVTPSFLSLNTTNQTIEYIDVNGDTTLLDISPLLKEPWYNVANGQQANSNIQDIYQMGRIGVNTNIPDPSAQMDISSFSKGILIPRMSETERDNIGSPAFGLLIFNTTEGCFNYWKSTEWKSICGGEAPAGLTISEASCNTALVQGTPYMQGDPLGSGAQLLVSLAVTKPGSFIVEGSSQNGYFFSASGSFPNPGNYTITLNGVGTPQNPAPHPGDSIIISVNGLFSGCVKRAVVDPAPVEFTMNCPSATFHGTYTQAIALGTSDSITLPINVSVIGNTVITTNTVNGISFSSGSVTLNTTGPQNITLYGSGTPSNPGTLTYTVNGSGAISSCTFDITAAPAPITYTMTCAGISTAGNYEVGKVADASNTMTIPVNVAYVGNWNISTDTINGISWSGSGTFAATGNQNVVLTASGTPINTGNFSYTITSNSSSGSTVCNKEQVSAYRVMNLLGLGGGGYTLQTGTTSYSATIIPKTAANFGKEAASTVKSLGLNVVAQNTNTGNTLRNFINNNNIDIIVVGYSYGATDATTLQVLYDFVHHKKGVLIFLNQATASIHAYINKIFATTGTTTTTGSTIINPVLGVAHPILNGPFGTISSGSLMGGDLNDNIYISSSLPSSATALMTKNGNSDHFYSIVHNTLGFVWVGDGGFIAGTAANTDPNAHPCAINTSGIPVPKTYNGGTVHNGTWYANTLAWAIEYVHTNTNTSYSIP